MALYRVQKCGNQARYRRGRIGMYLLRLRLGWFGVAVRPVFYSVRRTSGRVL